MRDYDKELLELARIKNGADERIRYRISTSMHAISLAYALLGAVVGLTLWLANLRSDLNQTRKEAADDRNFLSQVYEREFGVKITFR